MVTELEKFFKIVNALVKFTEVYCSTLDPNAFGAYTHLVVILSCGINIALDLLVPYMEDKKSRPKI